MPLIIPSNSQSATGYTIDQSIRFNDDDSAYMYRTPSANGSETKWTFSAWVKRGNISSDMDLFGHSNSDSAGDRVYITLLADNTLLMNGVGSSLTMSVITNQLFRDVSAWYHIIIAFDSTLSMESERVRFYLNGSRITSLKAHDSATPDYPSLNEGFGTNQTTRTHVIGRYNYGSGSRYFDGYMAEIHWLDGYAYGPEYFGEFDDFDNWIPKEYDGSYGTNGFKIDGRDSSDLGDDESGNGNDFSTSGFAADDQQPDSPTNNHAVFNPLDVASNGFHTFSEGNLAISYSGNSARELTRSSITIPANTDGFFEMKITADLGSGVDFAIGIEDGSALQDASNTTYTNGYIIREDGTFSTSGSGSTSSYGTSFDQNDVVGVWRKANGDLVFYKNGTAMNSGTPAVTGVTAEMHFVAGGFNGGAGIARFSSDQWTNTPTGVSSSMALTTKNLFG